MTYHDSEREAAKARRIAKLRELVEEFDRVRVRARNEALEEAAATLRAQLKGDPHTVAQALRIVMGMKEDQP